MGQLIGMLLMTTCIAFLSLESRDKYREISASKNSADEASIDLESDGINPLYGFLAILMGSTAAFFFAVKAVYIRLSQGRRFLYNIWDLAIDYLLF